MARIINTADLSERGKLTANDNSWIYNGLDGCVTLEVLEAIKPQLDNTTAGTYNFSRELQAPILEMMMRGVRVDDRRRKEALHEFRNDLTRLEAIWNELCYDGLGAELNWRSPQQLIWLFYTALGIKPIRKRNAQGRMVPTVNREALEEKLQAYFYAEPFCNLILAMRDLGKKIGFLETGIDPDGRIRTNFNIAGTNTGRLSSSTSDWGTGTNVQNITSLLRSVFISDPGYKFANLDLEQADSRNLGAMCWNVFVERYGEEFAGAYLDVCESGDLHTNVCKMVWPDLPWTGDRVQDRKLADAVFYRWFSRRDLSKKLGHGTNFVGQPPTMAKHSKVEVDLIKDFQARYFGQFPVIPKYHGWVASELHEHHTLTTLFGRRRVFWGRTSSDPKNKDALETLREAVAYVPQSMTADEIDTGIIKLWREDKVQLLIQVHDSILLQYPEEMEDEIVPWALEALRVPIMLERGREFCVPTEAKVGWNWGDVKYNEDGTVKDNPDGLIKWAGHDARTRQENRR